MNLKSEVLRRLLLTKSLLSSGQSVVGDQPNDHLVSRQLLNAHDAADLAFAAIADHQGNLPPKLKDSMPQCLDAIVTTVDKSRGYFRQLHEARNILKHDGVLPNVQQWGSVAVDVFEKLSSICNSTLGVNLENLDELDFLVREDVREHLSAAKQYRVSGELKSALEEVGKALFAALNKHPNLREIGVGRGKAEDAVKLTTYGISAGDFLRLQEFLPEVSKFLSEPLRLSWRQSKFGHPGNWRDEVVDFCIRTCLSVALSIQSSPPIPEPVEFQYRYQYKVTAQEDQVEVWEDLTEDHLSEVSSNYARPFRTHVRYLKKGDTIIVPFMDPLASSDLSLAGDEIRRVQIRSEGFNYISGMLGLKGRSQYVNLAQVNLTCIPHKGEFLGQDFPKLSEIPWEADPNDSLWRLLDFVAIAPKAPPTDSPSGERKS